MSCRTPSIVMPVLPCPVAASRGSISLAQRTVAEHDRLQRRQCDRRAVHDLHEGTRPLRGDEATDETDERRVGRDAQLATGFGARGRRRLARRDAVVDDVPAAATDPALLRRRRVRDSETATSRVVARASARSIDEMVCAFPGIRVVLGGDDGRYPAMAAASRPHRLAPHRCV